jgi:hypothetical protein
MADISEKQPLPVYPTNQGYPAGNMMAPNVVHVVPQALVGQQYRDQCKSLPSYSLEICILIITLVFALCAQGQHERKTEYGVCGIITAIVCLPSSSLQKRFHVFIL